MASTEKAADPETGKQVEMAPPPVSSKVGEPTPPPPPPPPPRSPLCKWMTVDIGLRLVLFASTLTAVLVMVTSKQTAVITVMGLPFPVRLEAKFNQSPAFIYYVTALTVACFYSIITSLASISVILKPAFSTSFLLLFVILDVVVLGLVASAIGTAGGVGYVGLKGNSHSSWMKVCNIYDKFCQHLAGSIAVSLFAAFVLVFLIICSTLSLHKKIPK